MTDPCYQQGHGPDTDRLHLWAAMHDRHEPPPWESRDTNGCVVAAALAAVVLVCIVLVLALIVGLAVLLAP